MPSNVTPSGAVVPQEQWRPAVPVISNDPTSRSPSVFLEVAGQFDVVHAARYQPVRGGTQQVIQHTWCNIYASDVTAAMGAEIPHWVNPDSSPAKFGTNGSRELTANATLEWLVSQGPAYGWLETDEPTARQQASTGCPAVACWENPLPGHSGHIAIILPDDPAVTGTCIAQAGAQCLFRAPLAQGFGSIKPRFFNHA